MHHLWRKANKLNFEKELNQNLQIVVLPRELTDFFEDQHQEHEAQVVGFVPVLADREHVVEELHVHLELFLVGHLDDYVVENFGVVRADVDLVFDETIENF